VKNPCQQSTMDPYSVPYADVIKSTHKNVFTLLGRRMSDIRASGGNFQGLLDKEPNQATFVAAVTALSKMFKDRHGESPALPMCTTYHSFMTTLFVIACEERLVTPLADVSFNCAAINFWDSVSIICDIFTQQNVKTWNDIPAGVTARCLENYKIAIMLYRDFLFKLRATYMELIDQVGGIMYIYPMWVPCACISFDDWVA
jgi:hypothetical protein